MSKLIRLKEARDRVLENPLSYILVGAVAAIVASRLYVFLGGSTAFSIDGVTFHHFFAGVAIMAVVGIIAFMLSEKERRKNSVRLGLAFIFGIGLGLVIDEANLFLVGGQNYTLGQYYLPADVVTEFIMVGLIFAAMLITTFWKWKWDSKASSGRKSGKR